MKYFLDPHGCAKNQVDAETMMAELAKAGWSASPEVQDADLVIVNTCGFIESAKAESIEAALSYKAAYPDKKLLLAGCLAQRYAEQLSADFAEADAFFGNADLSRVAEAAAMAMGEPGGVLKPEIDPSGDRDFASCTDARPLLSLPGSAYVKITEGCDNCCSYCAIPLIRGTLRSRSLDSIVEECRGLLARGVKELCLIGQDLGSFGVDKGGACLLPELLDALTALPGRFWIRLLYIPPDNFPVAILDRCERDPRILPYFDIPFQHASARILRAMNRRGDAETYLALIAEIRRRLPSATVRSTFLVGFPSETEDDFLALLDFQAQAGIDWLGAFAYSREEETAAFSMKGRVSKKLAADRKRRVEEAQGPICEERMERFVGRTLDLLVEEKVEGEEGLYLARAACQAPEVDGATVLSSNVPLSPGSFTRGRIFRRAGIDLDAANVGESDA